MFSPVPSKPPTRTPWQPLIGTDALASRWNGNAVLGAFLATGAHPWDRIGHVAALLGAEAVLPIWDAFLATKPDPMVVEEALAAISGESNQAAGLLREDWRKTEELADVAS
jgi:hypothetical protein